MAAQPEGKPGQHERTKERLRVRAAKRKRSMEDEARNILRAALAESEGKARNLAEAIRRRFEPLGGVELELPAREPMRSGAALATRNVADYDGCGIRLINPWEAGNA